MQQEAKICDRVSDTYNKQMGPRNDEKGAFGMLNGICIPSAPCLEQKFYKLHGLAPFW